MPEVYNKIRIVYSQTVTQCQAYVQKFRLQTERRVRVNGPCSANKKLMWLCALTMLCIASRTPRSQVFRDLIGDLATPTSNKSVMSVESY